MKRANIEENLETIERRKTQPPALIVRDAKRIRENRRDLENIGSKGKQPLRKAFAIRKLRVGKRNEGALGNIESRSATHCVKCSRWEANRGKDGIGEYRKRGRRPLRKANKVAC